MEILEVSQSIEQIKNLQQECHSYVRLLTKQQIEKLLNDNHFFLVRDNEWIIQASLYKLPLLDWVTKEGQFYRIWWLSVRGFSEWKLSSRKYLLRLMREFWEYVRNEDLQLIARTKNPTLSKYLIKNWLEEYLYLELEEQLPDIIWAFKSFDWINEENYEKQKFYVRTK